MVKPSADALRRRVDAELLGFLERTDVVTEPEARPLLDELEAIVRAGGKRLRPRFAYWGYRAAGGTDGAPIIRAGAALELLHTFAIIYDDVMDRSPLRRQRHSSFRALSELSEGVPHRGEPKRFGTAAALLTGLLGFVLADRLLWTSGFEAPRLEAMTARYDAMRTRAIAGQYLDVFASHRGEASEETARRIGALKSGAYSVVDPLVIGALGADASADVVRGLEAYGTPLGEAFQIADDILGVFGDPEETGKDRDGDLREGKQTVLLARTRELASPEELRVLDECVGTKDLPAAGAERVREIMTSTGALDATRKLALTLKDDALAALDDGPIDGTAVSALRELAVEATVRDA
jgi:geranylgeranyl diphosphate synthase type I